MDEARRLRLLARVAPRGYDPETRTFRPWHRFGRYRVELKTGRGIAHVLGTRIVLSDPGDKCPHVVAHELFHEVGHVQMLPLDIGVLVGPVLGVLEGRSWIWYVVGFLAFHFVWREITADLYAATRLGWRNVLRGYTHMGRSLGPSRRPKASGDERGGG